MHLALFLAHKRWRIGTTSLPTPASKRCQKAPIEVVDIAVPPDNQKEIVAQVLRHRSKIRGILAQKPLGTSLQEAQEIVRMCDEAGVTLAVNQNMRYDQAVRAAKSLLDQTP
ncbi:MAG: Gfo/Idh/MocA family oxidoreductase [Pirellulales bacterium]